MTSDIQEFLKNFNKDHKRKDKDNTKKTLTLADLENGKPSRTFIKSDDDD
jgi:hypothetical protein